MREDFHGFVLMSRDELTSIERGPDQASHRAATRLSTPPESAADGSRVAATLLHVALEILRRDQHVYVLTPEWLAEQIQRPPRRPQRTPVMFETGLEPRTR